MNSLPATLFPKRLSRLPYLGRIVIVYVLFWLIGRWKRSLALPLTEVQFYEYLSGTMGLVIYSTVFVILPRLRDSGLEWWYVLLSLVPLLNWLVAIILAIQPSKIEVAVQPANQPLEQTASRSLE